MLKDMLKIAGGVILGMAIVNFLPASIKSYIK